MSGFGAHFKGDVSEVTMGHETGLYIEDGHPRSWTATDNTDYTTITFTGTTTVSATSIFEQQKPVLKVPLGMLIGQKLTFHNSGAGSGAYTSHYASAFQSRVFSIVDHTFESDATVIKVVPALQNIGSGLNSATGDVMFIHSLGMPTAQGDSNNVQNTAAASSKEVSLADQFIGLASFMTLPDTTVDVHSYHVVGLGRQTAVQQTGKVHHTGGAIELPMHNAKWLYYSLGREVVSKDRCGDRAYDSSVVPTIHANVSPGQTYIDVASSQSGSVRFGVSPSNHVDAAVGHYILIEDTTLAPTTTYKTPETGTTQYWPSESSSSTLASDAVHFEWAETSECRRICAIDYIKDLGAGTYRYVYRLHVDDAWQFSHTTTDTLELRRYSADDSNGSPHINADSKNINSPVHRLLFSADTIPSFCMEHSVRTRDLGSFNATGESTVSPGSEGDSKQLTRVFRGCKVVEWELSSTVDAELKYRCVFDALSVYTDTGRLESSNKGDRYTAHRMFQNTANSESSRKVAGIPKNGEKPFMFYNGSISMFDQNITYISAFELRGKTGVELFHTLQSNPVAESVDASTSLSLKQVPYGGTRNASVIREGREEFEMEVTLALQDATLLHEIRTHIQRGGTVGSTGGTIMLHFTKPTSTGASGYTPELRVVIDDYLITALPVPVPDDKGLLFTTLKLKPQNIKVMSTDTDYHL